MSCEKLFGLDELFDYKNQLMGDILMCPDIVNILTDGASDLQDPGSLVYKQVFPYEFVPETIDSAQTFICCDVDIQSVRGKMLLNPLIYIWIFTHKSKMQLDGGGIRTDRLASKITEVINGSRMYGLGELELASVRRFSPIDDYYGRVLVFEAIDFNRVSPSMKPVPGNRKH